MNAIRLLVSLAIIVCSVSFCSAPVSAQNYYGGGTAYGSSYKTQPSYRRLPPGYQQGISRPGYNSGRRQVSNYVPIGQANPGQHRIWKHAEGTSIVGYRAPDGSCWKLLEAKGTYVIDASGRRRMVAGRSGSPSNQYVWKIERTAQTTRNAWICRDPETGSLSIVYRRPTSTKLKFYSALLTLDAARKITNLRWNETPIWADSVTFVKSSSVPALPRRSYRSTSQSFVRATSADLLAARRVLNPVTQTLNFRAARGYEQNSSIGQVEQWRQRMRQPRTETRVPPVPVQSDLNRW